MTTKEACRVLGVAADASLQEIKKRYRRLMTQVHPDVHVSMRKHYAYSAREINIAYSVLRREREQSQSPGGGRSDDFSSNTSSETASDFRTRAAFWDAPINRHAYVEREIFHYAEDFDGNVIGHFSIARGKYFWTLEEDFPLFLRSIYQCTKELLDEIDESVCRHMSDTARQPVQAELAYLLAQQFMEHTALLKEITRSYSTDTEGTMLFHLSAMLETSGKAPVLQPEELLYPAGIRRHRLFLKNRAGRELGYLSFRDDRLYYIIVPLLERRGVLVRVQSMKKTAKTKRWQPLDLWLKVPADTKAASRHLHFHIENLLQKYRENI